MDQETTARFERIEAILERNIEANAHFEATVRGAITVQQEQIAELTRISAKHEEQIIDLHKQFLAYLIERRPPQ